MGAQFGGLVAVLCLLGGARASHSVRSWLPEPPPPAAPLQVALAVSHRDSVLGCHSFARFLDARWETFFLFEREFARAWALDALVPSLPSLAAARPSRGVHLVEFHTLPSQLGARALVLDLLARRGVRLDVLVAASCDVHALPPAHVQHLPFSAMVHSLVDSLVADSARRRSRAGDGTRAELYSLNDLRVLNVRVKQTDTCLRRFEKGRRRPLLGACALLVETPPRLDSLTGVRVHGEPLDIGGWLARGGDKGFRPDWLSPGEPWLSDSSMWLPDRLCAYNASLLAPLLEQLRSLAGTLVDPPRIWSAVLCARRVGAVQNNDVVALVDTGSVSALGSHDSVGRGWLQRYALRALAAQTSPHACLAQLATLSARAALKVDWWCTGAAESGLGEHLPGPRLDSGAWARWMGLPPPRAGASASELVSVRNVLHELLEPLLELAGHRLARVNTTHAIFAHVPSFGSRYMLTLRGEGHVLRAGSKPWLQTVANGVAEATFASRPLGESACFLAFALGGATPPQFELPLDAVVVHVEAPVALGLGRRGERVSSRVWARLTSQYCVTVDQLRNKSHDLADAARRGGELLLPTSVTAATGSVGRLAGESLQPVLDALQVLEPLARSWCSDAPAQKDTY
ncbi:hypothetical protein T492DRAFT_850298 [Pavlovales sp. CCMP2436]|nr:hypothetical protein T492DRAFT_850298 [Pavlovales sp. CCMP2436]